WRSSREYRLPLPVSAVVVVGGASGPLTAAGAGIDSMRKLPAIDDPCDLSPGSRATSVGPKTFQRPPSPTGLPPQRTPRTRRIAGGPAGRVRRRPRGQGPAGPDGSANLSSANLSTVPGRYATRARPSLPRTRAARRRSPPPAQRGGYSSTSRQLPAPVRQA